MGFSNGAFAKIKEVDSKANFTKAKIVISKRVPHSEPAQYVCTFAGWVSCVGKSHQCRPMAGQKIQIVSCDTTNGYLDGQGQQKFTNSPQYVIFEHKLQQDGSQGNTYVPSAYTQGSSGGFEQMDMGDESSLPF